VEATAASIRKEGGVPNFFGPQRFGGHFRPVTHLVGRAIVEGDLEEAVRLYVGNPMEMEQEEAQAARKVYDETRDPAAALAIYPSKLDPERAILQRLARRPGDWRNALQALPPNLLQLFVHAHQSWLFNLILSARVEGGLGLNTAHDGDLVMGIDDDGVRVHKVSAFNQARVQRELDLGRSTLTAPLVGLTTPLATGEPGEVEQQVLDALRIEMADFRVREIPEVASDGRRRGILQPVRGLDVSWVEGDPVFAFALGKGSYATVVLREFMKAAIADY
jgi:tRNA pseudouridine13 synthase